MAKSKRSQRYKFPEARKKLLKMYKEDQNIRAHGDFNDVNTVLRMAKIDLRHQKQLKKILESIKLPSVKNIGYDGAEAVWLIGQHAGYNLQLMKRILNLIKRTTKRNPKNGYYRGIPYLIDRIRVMEGKPQLYGTQFWNNPSGIPTPYTIDDKKGLEKRRAEFGLQPFSEYLHEIKAEYTKNS